MRPPLLSKSRYVAGLQCPLRLWYQCYDRKLATAPSPTQQAVFDMGNEVGLLATKRYPGGVMIEEDYRHHDEAEISTRRAIDPLGAAAVFEAAFSFDGVRIRADILERVGDGQWRLIEVKSSASVKGVYLDDVGIQCHVLRGAGLEIVGAGIMHLNGQYVYDGSGFDLGRLFELTDLTEEVAAREDEVVSRLAGLKDTLLNEAPPDIGPSRHCHKPYTCEFWDHCTSAKPKFWIMNLSGLSRGKFDQLSADGVEDILEIPAQFPLTKLQERIRECVAEKREFISPDLEAALGDAAYPIHFLDFETAAAALPRYAGTRSYQAIPFQWSDHVMAGDGTLTHRAYLCAEDKDPREEFTETLLDALGQGGDVFVYTAYEKGILSQMAERFPNLKDRLEGVVARFRDLYAIIRKHYYHPEFNGSFSLKSVLPVLAPEFGYGDLKIQAGNAASLEYLRMIAPATPARERDNIRNNLLLYCERDTLAMVKVREVLLRRACNGA